MRHICRLPLAIAVLLLAGPARAAPPAGAPAEPAAVVAAFNSAISRRDLQAVAAQLAPGGVQFALRPAHSDAGAPADKLTSDLRTHWSAIAPVLYSVTKSYTRKAEVLDAHVDGDIATVWTRTTTDSVRTATPQPIHDSFVEVYLLVRHEGRWVIGAIADNRQPGGQAAAPAKR